MEDPQKVITVPGPEWTRYRYRRTNCGTTRECPNWVEVTFTFSNENNYMIWAYFLKKCWEKGWLYRGADVMPWCPRCATGISQHEIVTDGYAELTHRAVTLRFPLREATNSTDPCITPRAETRKAGCQNIYWCGQQLLGH
jgi:valyl-tRNA synthetase